VTPPSPPSSFSPLSPAALATLASSVVFSLVVFMMALPLYTVPALSREAETIVPELASGRPVRWPG